MALTQGPSALRTSDSCIRNQRFHIQTIMWLEVSLPHTDYYVTWSSAVPLPHMEYSLAWSSASAQGIYWDLKFRFRIQNSVCLEALKWRDSASAQGRYCGLEVTQFCFHTINLVRLEVSQFRFHTRALTLSPASPPPHKEYSVTWRSAVSLPHKEYTMSRSSAVLLSHTEQSVTWSSAVRTIYCDWISAVPLPQEKTSFEIPHFCFCTRTLLFFGKSTLIQPPTHFLIFMLSYMNDGPSEGQRNKESECSLQKSSLTFGCARHKLMTHYVHTGTVRDRAARQASRYDHEKGAVLLCWHTYVNAFGWRQYQQTLWIICQYDP